MKKIRILCILQTILDQIAAALADKSSQIAGAYRSIEAIKHQIAAMGSGIIIVHFDAATGFTELEIKQLMFAFRGSFFIVIGDESKSYLFATVRQTVPMEYISFNSPTWQATLNQAVEEHSK